MGTLLGREVPVGREVLGGGLLKQGSVGCLHEGGLEEEGRRKCKLQGPPEVVGVSPGGSGSYPILRPLHGGVLASGFGF